MDRLVPLDWGAVVRSPIALHVVASSLTELRPVVMSSFEGPEELRTALAASARIPFLAGPPVELRGRRLVDAAVLQAHPYESAVRDDCTHVLSLSTRPLGRVRRGPGPLQWLWSRRLERLRPGLGDRSLDRLRRYPVEQRRLLTLTASAGGPPFVLDVAPAAGTDQVGNLERNPFKILLGARAGYEAAGLALTGQPVRAVFQLRGAGGLAGVRAGGESRGA
jgi:predicted acylesterase/phospholipase RssA